MFLRRFRRRVVVRRRYPIRRAAAGKLRSFRRRR